MRPNAPAIILIVLGCLFLARNLDLFDFNLAHLIGTWWPLILIAIGVSMLFRGSDSSRPQ
ncbi:MAG TPA: hypothetical protein DDZ76_12490 [Xanthomonadales bacterium]|nr:hypothetical protein [Xanthomonadales bacterium]